MHVQVHAHAHTALPAAEQSLSVQGLETPSIFAKQRRNRISREHREGGSPGFRLPPGMGKAGQASLCTQGHAAAPSCLRTCPCPDSLPYQLFLLPVQRQKERLT